MNDPSWSFVEYSFGVFGLTALRTGPRVLWRPRPVHAHLLSRLKSQSENEKWRWVSARCRWVVHVRILIIFQDVKPVVEENGGEAVLRLSLAQPGSDPVSVRAKSSTLVSK
jgi:hypothetical protein